MWLQRINLATGAKTAVARINGHPRGVLVTSDGQFIYVSIDPDTITRFDLATNSSDVIASGLNGPRFLTWADDSESIILFPQYTTSEVSLLDLTASPPMARPVAGPTQAYPCSVAVVSPNQLLITSFDEVSSVDLTSSKYSATGPILLGIGFVPADATHLPGGYADTCTPMDKDYFFQVKDCPFGGTLPLMINWPEAHKMKANYYQVFITPFGGTKVQVNQPFSDYLWNVNHFDLVPTVPDAGGFYKLRSAGETWLNNWLGLLLDTTGQPNGLNTISIKLFSAANSGREVGSKEEGRSATLMIDNTMPVAILEQILHQPGNQVVDACAIVNTGLPMFTFKVTAAAPQSHLRGWDLTAYWGDNKSKPVAADNYSSHIGPSRLWAGITSVAVPPPPGPSPWDATVLGDQTSKHCAHSFFLTAWDRVINGWGYIHEIARYQKSVTLMF